MDICEHRDAETKPLIFCVVARDGMPSKVWENLGVSEKWAIGEDIGFQSRVNAIQLLDLWVLVKILWWIAMISSNSLDWTFHKILTKLSQSRVIDVGVFFSLVSTPLFGPGKFA